LTICPPSQLTLPNFAQTNEHDPDEQVAQLHALSSAHIEFLQSDAVEHMHAAGASQASGSPSPSMSPVQSVNAPLHDVFGIPEQFD
jgi:hypothetical protein